MGYRSARNGFARACVCIYSEKVSMKSKLCCVSECLVFAL